MGFRQADSEGRGGYARIWSVEDKGNYSVVKLSTSKKRRDGEGYETDFQDGFVRFVGSAHEKIRGVVVGEKGASIQITSCDVTINYNATTKKSYTNYVVFAFDGLDDVTNDAAGKSAAKTSKGKANKGKAAPPVEEDDDADAELPF